MTRNVLEAVNRAREFFEIEDFPGDFFTLLEKVDYTDKYNLLLFKEDIDKLSGFIGYGSGNMAVICVNYKRPQGHQNFTLAHEIGHWFIHKGISISDDDRNMYSTVVKEKEANEFAKELLYPDEHVKRDYNYAVEHRFFIEEKRNELGIYVNNLCHKYCLSFELVLRNLLYKNRQASQYKTIRKEIENALGGRVAEIFDKDFYVPNIELPQYQQLLAPYAKLRKNVDKLVEQKKIGRATGEAIKLRYEMEKK